MYYGQGFAIGGDVVGAVGQVRADGLTFDGSSAGLRVQGDRSRGGLVEDVRFENVCMRGVKAPLVIAAVGEGAKATEFRGLVVRNMHSVESGVAPGVLLAGVDVAHRLEITLENVVIDGVRAAEVTARHAVATVRRGESRAFRRGCAGDGRDRRRRGVRVRCGEVRCVSGRYPDGRAPWNLCLWRTMLFTWRVRWYRRLQLSAGCVEQGSGGRRLGGGGAGGISRTGTGTGGACNFAQRKL